MRADGETLPYEGSGTGEVPGRDKGFRIAGTVHDISYGYPVIPPAGRETGLRDALGRLAGVASSSSLLTNDYSFVYGYTNETDLVQTLTETNSQFTVTRSYEANRDLLTQVKNEIGTATVSQYDYLYDAIGLRTSVVNRGTAFAADAHNAWGYNDRGELIASDRHYGTDPSNPGPRGVSDQLSTLVGTGSAATAPRRAIGVGV